MKKRTSITLSRAAFKNNIDSINALTGHQSLAFVVKSNAYGHGIFQMASLADLHPGVSWICTAGIDEALYLRNKGILKPILVLSYLDGDLEEAVRRGMHLCVSSLAEAQAISAAAQRTKSQAYIHVKIDTGMGRLGLLPDEAAQAIHTMTQLPQLTVYGAFTHLSDTGHEDISYCEQQLSKFDSVLDDLEAGGIPLVCTHAQSSSSLNVQPKRRYSFIRAGASAYGLWKSEKQRKLFLEIDPSFDLTPVLEWRASILSLKQLPTGSEIGYQRTFITKRPTTLALVPIGYWDGYSHALSNKGTALVKGQEVPAVGIISMNLAAFDVTDVPDISLSDELVLLGNAEGIRPHQVAQKAQKITNEITTLIHPSVKRTIVEQHQPLLLKSSNAALDYLTT